MCERQLGRKRSLLRRRLLRKAAQALNRNQGRQQDCTHGRDPAQALRTGSVLRTCLGQKRTGSVDLDCAVDSSPRMRVAF